MTCVHKVRWSVKRPEDCCFRLSVSHYKDRIVAPDEYAGPTEVTPSDQTQVLPTADKLVRDDITIFPAPTEVLSTDHNGTFTPSEGKVGFYQVDVNVNPDLRPLSVSENGQYSPDGFDGYSGVSVNTPVPSGSIDITDNGTYDVSSKSSVNVAVEGQWIDYDNIPVTLPDEYQRVEYIESSGTQYINLPYGFAPTDTISMRSSINTSMGGDKFMVSPTRWNDDNNRFGLCGLASQKYFIFAYGVESTGNSIYTIRYTNDGDLHDFYYSAETFYIVDLTRAGGAGGIAFGAETYVLRLFYGYNANTNGKIAHFVHKKADGRKLALYACYRKSDGVIGMYDVENDVFYTNDGSGDFTKGQDI